MVEFYIIHADVAELADAPDLGSGVYDVQVQVLLSAVYLNHKDSKGTSPVPLLLTFSHFIVIHFSQFCGPAE